MDDESNIRSTPENAPEAETPKKAKDGNVDSKTEIYEWIQCVLASLVVGIFIFTFVVRVVNVKGPSMIPTLHDEDAILISNLFYTPKAGDVVVFQTDSYGEEPLVKRVIATAGQTVDIDFEAGVVYVDGVALSEPYVNEPTYVQDDFSGPVTVPEGCIFVMGDNRNHSTDSRRETIGMVDEKCIIGKVLLILFPSDVDGYPRDLGRIGSIY